ncbi:DUF1992 domain-containing protein [Pseudonocardia sp. H11422]|uniref:DnaJ family domain-containing protein n=1 Tax=Pseudonocardia sp. H11422 TaxID=2835866 RepID=UPI0027E31865|nr:DUF1992 domain-containing protein [Pseudonocardia sp. H11422]
MNDFGSRYESVVDKQIRMAQERSDFDDLPGKGKPLPGLDGPADDLWWVKGFIRREGLSTEALLPTPLQLRKEIERLPETVRGLPSERVVRDVVAELNLRIVDWLRAPSGPRVQIAPVNVDDVVGQWRAGRRAVADRPPAPAVPASTAAAGGPAPVVAPGRASAWGRTGRRLSGTRLATLTGPRTDRPTRARAPLPTPGA